MLTGAVRPFSPNTQTGRDSQRFGKSGDEGAAHALPCVSATSPKGPTVKKSLCAFALVATCLIGIPTTAQADTKVCVSPGEYSHVHRGMTKRRVHRVFGSRGRRVAFSRRGRHTSEIRRYRGCPRRSMVSVSYVNGRLRAKSARFPRD